MYKLTIFVLFVSGAINYCSATDYCDAKLCTNYQGVVKKHIGCKNDGSFESRCPADAKIIPMTDDLKSLIVKSLNEYRNKIASGQVPDYEPASKMTEMQWDDELSSLAEYNVKQCTMKHDKCHNTDKYTWSGQNLGHSWATGSDPDPKVEFPYHIKRWFDESNDCDQSVIDNYHGSDGGPGYGHFTAMVNHKSDRVGCAASQYVSDINGLKGTNTLIACNFSYTNLQNEPVYLKGESCSKCTKGCSTTYPALCSKSEVVKYIPDILQ